MNRPTRQTLLAFTTALLLGIGILVHGASSVTEAADRNPEKPNFVVIFIDDMGYGDIGPFGSTINRTPHLDRLTRRAFMTGRQLLGEIE